MRHTLGVNLGVFRFIKCIVNDINGIFTNLQINCLKE